MQVNSNIYFTNYLLYPISEFFSKSKQAICCIASIALKILSAVPIAIYKWCKRDVVDRTTTPTDTDSRISQTAAHVVTPQQPCLENKRIEILEKIQKSQLEESIKRQIIEYVHQIIKNSKQQLNERTKEPKRQLLVIQSALEELNRVNSMLSSPTKEEVKIVSLSEWCQQMSNALQNGNKKELKSLLNEHSSYLNKKNPPWMGGTALHHLAKLGHHCALVKILVNKGIDLNFQDIFGNTALLWAIANGQNSMALEILKHKQDLNIKGYGNTALHLAIAKGYKNRTVDRKPLHVSNLKLVQAMVREGANPNLKNKNGFTALHLACIRRDPSMIKALLDKGGNLKINAPGRKSCQELLEMSHEEAMKAIKKITPPFLLPKEDFDTNYETCKKLITQA